MRVRTLILAAGFAAFSTAGAQNRQPDFSWSKALAAGSHVRIHNISGDIDVVPSTSDKVEVTAFRTRDADDDIKAVVYEGRNGIDVCVVRPDDECDEHGLHSEGDHWGRNRSHGDMDLRVAVPANLDVAASSVSGDVNVNGAHGDLDAHSVSGSVRLEHLRVSSLNANSVSGDVSAQIDALTGNGDLTFHSVSGDVTLDVPKTFDADLRMHSVSGQLTSDFPVTLRGGFSRRSMDARIGNGGRRLDVSTVSGDLRIRTPRS